IGCAAGVHSSRAQYRPIHAPEIPPPPGGEARTLQLAKRAWEDVRARTPTRKMLRIFRPPRKVEVNLYAEERDQQDPTREPIEDAMRVGYLATRTPFAVSRWKSPKKGY